MFILQLHKAIPNWDEIRSERRKRQRALADKGESSHRKRARLEQKVVVPVLEDYDDEDEDMEKPEDEVKPENTLSETEKDVLEKLSPQMAAELVLASMVRFNML